MQCLGAFAACGSAAAFGKADGPAAACHGEVLRSRASSLLRYDNLESGSQLCLASGAASRPRGTVHVGTTLRYLGAERPSLRMRRNGALTPDSARQKAKQALGELAAGRDPWGSPRQKAELGVTFGGQVPRFLERQRSALKRRSMIEVTHHLMVHAAPTQRQAFGQNRSPGYRGAAS
jgi:hypothetical protein